MARRPRVLVSGTIFGQVYLEAFRRPDSPFELAGIVSRGSERSRLCAQRLGVPLFTSIEEVPSGIDMACVVIRSGLLGGHGTELSQALMRRGIHVLQEHPLHHDELADCLRTARKHRVVYHLNSFYVHIDPVRRFIAAASELFQRQRPLFVEAECGFQVAYSLLDILGEILGAIRPWTLAEVSPRSAFPFRHIEGSLAGIPLSLRIQNQLDPSDPDNFSHLLHHVTVGTEGGRLSLPDTHGPTLWSARPRFPREVRQDHAQPHFSDDTDRAEPPVVTVIGPQQTAGYAEIFASVWPKGVERALQRLHRASQDGEEPLRRGQYHLALCQLWQEITERLGPPDLVRASEPQPLDTKALQAIATATELAKDRL